MKKRYERPSAYIEEFTPNEYVAACGDSGTIYKFRCNAGKKKHSYNVYYMDGNKKRYIANNNPWDWEAQFDYYHPCGTTHEAESNSGFIRGYMDDQSTREDEKTPVYIWTEGGTDVHCTTDLDPNTWETLKS